MRNEGLTFASANMPDTKTQAEGTPCSLVLQPNSEIGVGIYTENSEHKFKMSMIRICLERGWDVLDQPVNLWT